MPARASAAINRAIREQLMRFILGIRYNGFRASCQDGFLFPGGAGPHFVLFVLDAQTGGPRHRAVVRKKSAASGLGKSASPTTTNSGLAKVSRALADFFTTRVTQ